MIKLYKSWKLIETYKWEVKDIKRCAFILKKYGIQSKYPWIDLITKARKKWYILKNY